MLPVCASRKGNLILFSNAIRVLKDAEFSTASRYVESWRRLKKKKITLMLPNKDRKTNYCCNFSTIGRFTTIPDAAITPISLFLEEMESLNVAVWQVEQHCQKRLLGPSIQYSIPVDRVHRPSPATSRPAAVLDRLDSCQIKRFRSYKFRLVSYWIIMPKPITIYMFWFKISIVDQLKQFRFFTHSVIQVARLTVGFRSLFFR